MFEKVEGVKVLVSKDLGEVSASDLLRIVQRLANRWQYKKKRNGYVLSKEELRVYEVLLRNKLNPQTVYRWMLLCKSPTEIKNRIAEGNLSLRNASKEKQKFKYLFRTSERELMRAIADCINRYVMR